MPKRIENTTDDLLRDLIIVQLGLVGVPGQTIRKIVGCKMNKVTRIVRHLRKGVRENKQ
jgi:hypothetical protein